MSRSRAHGGVTGGGPCGGAEAAETDRPVATWLALLEAPVDPVGVRRWLDDTLRLAATERGEHARSAAEAPLLVDVYRELEAIERHERAELLRGCARMLARSVPRTLGAAALDLLAPFGPHADRQIHRGLACETERRVSERLLRAAVAPPLDIAALDPCADGGAEEIIKGLARLALALERGTGISSDADGRLAVLEVRLALGDPAAALAGLDDLADELRASKADATVALDAVERARAAAAFAVGDDATVLDLLGSGELAFDRSASAGAMHAAARHRFLGPASGAEGTDRDDCFLAPVGSEERGRVARFLAARSPRPIDGPVDGPIDGPGDGRGQRA